MHRHVLIEGRETAIRYTRAKIKAQDAHIRFAFLTGVSKFSKVNIFSGLNNLADITLLPGFSSICGYTDAARRSITLSICCRFSGSANSTLSGSRPVRRIFR
ncbi:MAG: AAA family ATPase [Zoogloeaceae bacterium]|nr:AAA family ATPase [Zoogloeaceae bacterium]